MARLIDLPNELLLDVASCLTTGDGIDVRTLYSLCRTSRTFLKIALPALYVCVRIIETTNDPLQSLKCFLRTILQYPELAEKTQRLAIADNRGVRYEGPALLWHTPFLDSSPVKEGEGVQVDSDLYYGSLVVDVLGNLPNLQHICFTAEVKAPKEILECIHQMQRDDSILSKLRSFHLRKRYESGPLDMKDYIPFLSYPLFERLSTESDVLEIPGSSPSTNILTPSTIELFWCIEPPEKMEAMLKACHHLNRFEFVVPSTSRFRSMLDVGADPLLWPQELLTLLLKIHGSNLKSLRLDYRHMYSLHDPQTRRELLRNGQSLTDNDYAYQSFLGFENLSSLSVEFEKLLNIDTLPSSLRSLDLTHCQFIELDQAYLQKLLQLKARRCPLIETVTVTGLEETDEGIAMVLEHARSLEAPLQITADGRMLTFSGAASYLQIRSRKALPLEEDTYESDVDSSSDY